MFVSSRGDKGFCRKLTFFPLEADPAAADWGFSGELLTLSLCRLQFKSSCCRRDTVWIIKKKENNNNSSDSGRSFSQSRRRFLSVWFHRLCRTNVWTNSNTVKWRKSLTMFKKSPGTIYDGVHVLPSALFLFEVKKMVSGAQGKTWTMVHVKEYK